MPTQPAKPCAHPGCRRLVTSGARCAEHARELSRAQDAGRDQATRALYNNARWRAASRAYLDRHPVCARCTELAAVVDHVIPHRGDYGLFWHTPNWQPLCKRCHDRKTATEDKKMHGGGGAKV